MRSRFILFLLALGCARAVAAADFKPGDPVEVLWGVTWYNAKVVAVDGARWKISYEGYGSNWDEFVGPDRIRPRGAGAAAATSPTTTGATAAAPAATPTFAFPARPPGKAAGVEGAFLRTESWFFNGRMSLNQQGWFFTKEGRVSLNPAGGFDFEAFRAATQARKSDGVYWIEDGKLTIVWASGAKPSVYTFERAADGMLRLDGLAATRVEGFRRGWRADVSYEGGATAGGSGSFVSSSSSLHLRRDGTFGITALGSVSARAGGETIGGSSGRSAAGTYQFDGYTLTLRRSDGQEERRTVFAFSDRDEQGAPEFLWREGMMLSRQDAAK